MMKSTIAILAGMLFVSNIGYIRAQITSGVQHVQADPAPIATAVWAKGLLFVSGQTASPIGEADGAKPGEPMYGDTKAQTISIFHKIGDILRSQSLSLKDVVLTRVYLVGIATQGRAMDFAGFQAG